MISTLVVLTHRRSPLGSPHPIRHLQRGHSAMAHSGSRTVVPMKPSCTTCLTLRIATGCDKLDRKEGDELRPPVYKSGIRVPTMKAARIAAALTGSAGWTLPGAGDRDVRRHRHQTQLGLPTGPAYYRWIRYTSSLIVMSRIVGWTAHIMEQAGANAHPAVERIRGSTATGPGVASGHHGCWSPIVARLRSGVPGGLRVGYCRGAVYPYEDRNCYRLRLMSRIRSVRSAIRCGRICRWTRSSGWPGMPGRTRCIRDTGFCRRIRAWRRRASRPVSRSSARARRSWH